MGAMFVGVFVCLFVCCCFFVVVCLVFFFGGGGCFVGCLAIAYTRLYLKKN